MTTYRCSVPRCHNVGDLVEVNGRQQRRCIHHQPREVEVLSIDDYDFSKSLAEQCEDDAERHERKYGI